MKITDGKKTVEIKISAGMVPDTIRTGAAIILPPVPCPMMRKLILIPLRMLIIASKWPTTAPAKMALASNITRTESLSLTKIWSSLLMN